MKSRGTSFILRWVALLFISAALILAMVQLANYSRQRSNYPAGMSIAGIPVGGLDPQSAAARILQTYNLPVELQYAGAVIHIDPALAGFEVNVESMLAAADLTRTGQSFWGGYWDFLWNRQPQPVAIPLSSNLDETRLRSYLTSEIAARYDRPATPAQPIPGTATFSPGQPGQELDIERAVIQISDALRSPTKRTVALSFQRTASNRPTLQNLQIQIQQLIDLSGFDGILGLYLLDLQTSQSLHFAYSNGTLLPVQPDIAFTASSTIKIPIMVTYFRQFGADVDEQTSELILEMIRQSENPPADALMDKFEAGRGPLVVTDTLQALGLENTFLAGYFYDGAPLLAVFTTPSNSRSDVQTNADLYNQTTPSEMGYLLEDIYQCSQTGGGALVAAFPGQIDQAECEQMISYLAQNKIGVLIEAGVPDGTRVAHKHGWISGPLGIIQNISDAAIVYTPGGNYVLTIYSYHPTQAIWDQVSSLFAQISEAVYNYFNLPQE